MGQGSGQRISKVVKIQRTDLVRLKYPARKYKQTFIQAIEFGNPVRDIGV